MLPALSNEARSLAAALKGSRTVYFGAEIGWRECPVYERDLLPLENEIAGPALVEEPTTTSLVQIGQTMRVTAEGIMLLRDIAVAGQEGR